ncbi:MAG TPA: DUF3291 domain-containing protein [Acidimicrobiales bacterium]|nr:DUF3291 domain-containing protein [Acidimicrobiales bacterium]
MSEGTSWHVAQLNIGRMKAPPEDPLIAEFMAALDPINALADAAPGFVWRLQTEDGNATAIRPYEDELMLVNMSTWETVEELADFVYRTLHRDVMVRRREWFEKMDELFTVLWWVPAGHVPSVDEAKERLERLRAEGPTPEAFTFRHAFPPPDAPHPSEPSWSDAECPTT